MAKSLLRNEISRIVSSIKPFKPKNNQPVSPNRVNTPRTAAKRDVTVKVEWPKKMEAVETETRKPLSKVVADCTKRWFRETLKEAKAGDNSMQLIVGQMYYSGYGVPKDPQKGHAWISIASRNRNSVWQGSRKQPGYKASDSDSCEQENKSTP